MYLNFSFCKMARGLSEGTKYVDIKIGKNKYIVVFDSNYKYFVYFVTR
jgi:hypothetical protein